MATANVLPAIAGLQRPPTSRDLELSRAVYVFRFSACAEMVTNI